MGGEAEIGKTYLGIDLAHNLAVGGALWGTDFKVVEPVPVYYFEQEVGEIEFQRRIKERYDVLGEDPPEKFYVSSRLREFFLDSSKGQSILAKEIESVGAKVAIIDPIGRCMIGDENSNAEVGRLFARFDELMVTYPELSFVIIHHFGKPPKEDDGIDPLSPYRFRGASKWYDCPDSRVMAMRMADHPGEWFRLKFGMRLRRGPRVEPIKLSVLPGGIVKPTVEQGQALKPGRWGH